MSSMFKNAFLLGALMLAAICSVPANAHEFKAGSLVIHHPWARATPKGAPVAGGFTVIENTGDQPDRLIGGSFSASSGFSIHKMEMKDGTMSMAEVEGGLEIPAHASVTLAPGSFHLMFTGLARELKKDESVSGTLIFEKAGTVPVSFKIEAIGAKMPGNMPDKMPGHDGHMMEN